MTLARPLCDALGVVLDDVDLHGDVPEGVKAEAREAFLDRHLVLVRGQQDLSADEQVRFVGWFGQPRRPLTRFRPDAGLEMYVSNTRDDAQGGQAVNEFVPHMDYLATPTLLPAICLYGQEVPAPGSGGATRFVNVERAYERLSPSMQARLSGLTATHVGAQVRAEAKHLSTLEVPFRATGSTPISAIHQSWPLIMTHPDTKRPMLFVSPLQTYSVDGMAASESDDLLAELFAALEDPAICYVHDWEVGDVIIWDNIALLHGRTAFPGTERRTLRKLEVDRAA